MIIVMNATTYIMCVAHIVVMRVYFTGFFDMKKKNYMISLKLVCYLTVTKYLDAMCVYIVYIKTKFTSRVKLLSYRVIFTHINISLQYSVVRLRWWSRWTLIISIDRLSNVKIMMNVFFSQYRKITISRYYFIPSTC